MKFIKTPVKGMCDMLPSDMRLREHVLGMIKETYGRYGFMQIETPVMEHIENLTSKQGGDNEKLIFKVMKRGADLQRAIEKGDGEYADNGLRYDLTVPLARYYANNREKLPTPFKAMQLGNVWRADNPQKGRFRQFTQCDIDILGDDSSLAEIELITATASMLSQIFAEIGVTDFTVHINDRQILGAVALAAGFSEEDIGSVLISLDKFDKIGLDGIRNDLLQGGYSEETVDRYLAVYRTVKEGVGIEEFCAAIPQEVLPARVSENLAEIIACVRPMLCPGVKIVFDPTLVRGMGYYTGPIFEVTIDGYNFSIGFERIVTILKDHMQGSMQLQNASAYLIGNRVSRERKAEVIAKAMELRRAGEIVTVLPMSKNVGHQIELLEAEGFTKFEKIYE